MLAKISTRAVVEDKEELFGCLEGKIKLDDERMVGKAQHVPFSECISSQIVSLFRSVKWI